MKKSKIFTGIFAIIITIVSIILFIFFKPIRNSKEQNIDTPVLTQFAQYNEKLITNIPNLEDIISIKNEEEQKEIEIILEPEKEEEKKNTLDQTSNKITSNNNNNKISNKKSNSNKTSNTIKQSNNNQTSNIKTSNKTSNNNSNTTKKTTTTIASYKANKMTHFIMDGKDADKCIAGKWCIGKDLSVASDTSVRYKENGTSYYVFAVHCSIIKEWRGSIIKVYYEDGGIETGIVLDCGGFAGHTNRMDKAMGTRYNGKQDNYKLSRYIKKTEVIRKGW